MGGCAGLLSLSDLERVGDDGGSIDGDGGLDGDGGQDVDSTDTGTDAPGVDANCDGGGPEICTDGLDNDCNGKTDCDDPACSAFACVAAAPAGWSFVAFSPNTRPACSPMWFPATDLKVLSSDAPSCACTCVGDGGTPCDAGAINVYWSTGSLCPAAPTFSVAANGTCQPVLSGPNMHPSDVVAFDVPPGPASCEPSAPPIPPPSDGRVCANGLGVGKCAGQSVCAPQAVAPLIRCVMQATAGATCPTGFPTHYQVGASMADARSCTGCTCGVTGCGLSLDLSKGNNCTNPLAGTLTPPGGCDAGGVNGTPRSGKVTVGAGCAVTAPAALDGSVEVTDEETICCP